MLAKQKKTGELFAIKVLKKEVIVAKVIVLKMFLLHFYETLKIMFVLCKSISI